MAGILLTSCTEMWPAFVASRIWATRGCPCKCLGVYVCCIMADVRNTFMSVNYSTDCHEWGAQESGVHHASIVYRLY